MPKMDYRRAKQHVSQKIGTLAYNKIVKFVKTKRPNLWGEQQPRDYLERNLVLALYKDLERIGTG